MHVPFELDLRVVRLIHGSEVVGRISTLMFNR